MVGEYTHPTFKNGRTTTRIGQGHLGKNQTRSLRISRDTTRRSRIGGDIFSGLRAWAPVLTVGTDLVEVEVFDGVVDVDAVADEAVVGDVLTV